MIVLSEKLWKFKKPASNTVFKFISLLFHNIKIRLNIERLLYTLKGELLQKDLKNATLAYLDLKQHKANESNDMLY